MTSAERPLAQSQAMPAEERQIKIDVLRAYGLDLPIAYSLARADILDLDCLDKMSDEEIMEVPNIWRAKLRKIRKAVKLWKQNPLLGIEATEDARAAEIKKPFWIKSRLRGNMIRPFRTSEPLKEEDYLEKEFALWEVGKVTISFERIVPRRKIRYSELESFEANAKREGLVLVAPYDLTTFISEERILRTKEPFLSTPCALEVTFSLSNKIALPLCVLFLPSCERQFVGIPVREDEGGFHFIWFDPNKGQECMVLLPNQEEVLREMMISFGVF